MFVAPGISVKLGSEVVFCHCKFPDSPKRDKPFICPLQMVSLEDLIVPALPIAVTVTTTFAATVHPETAVPVTV